MMFYKDYFGIKPDFNPIMTIEGINKNPDTWLGFYPHESFVEILRALLKSLDGGQKTIWITGAYGTGKSHASLVLQKLFNDDESRVAQWFDSRKEQIPDPVRKDIMERRKDSLFVVYDVNSDGVDAKNQFLMRMQRAIAKALQQAGYNIPLRGKMDEVIERIQQDEQYFFVQRNAMQSRLAHLNSSITTADELGQKLRTETHNAGLVNDIMQVLEARNIYLDSSADEFITWVEAVLDSNGLSKLVFIWDEFSSFIQRNSAELKTLEQLAEAAQQGRFYFIPVTHMDIASYWAEGSESAKKANGRFTFKRLEMPNDTALKLAADVFVEKEETRAEWKQERAVLWHAVKGVAENYMSAKGAGITPTDFEGILPLHPIAAFLLKYLAVAVGSNQRSMFEFLNNEEFRRFVNEGGVDVAGKQLLTVDHLWTYFIERDDLGTAQIVQEARAEFARMQDTLQHDERRVFKAVLLFGLIGQLQSEGHPLLNASVENICRSFEGDGDLQGVEAILRDLEQKHCFTIVNGRCERFRDSTNTKEIEEKVKSFENKFNEFILSDTGPELSKLVQTGTTVTRFDVRVTSITNFTPSAITKRESFSKDGNRILLQFVLARDGQEQSRIPEKVLEMAKHFHDHRMLFLTMPDISFCRDDANVWEKFKEYAARKSLAKGDKNMERVYEAQLTKIKDEWYSKIRNATRIRVCKTNPNGEPFEEVVTKGQVKDGLIAYSKQVFDAYTDDLCGFNHSAFGALTHLQSWATAGMEFAAFAKTGQWKTVIGAWQRTGISAEESWFDQHSNHALTKMRDFCKKRQDSTIGAGNTCSIRKLYMDLQRPPYGLLCAPHSAFVLGFVLKTWLTGQRKLQWTDGVTSKPLDAATLAEIIEAVVKDDGANAIKNEKLICRLSREEKAFIDQSSIIFGNSPTLDGTVEAALTAVGNRIQQISEGVPLWILPQFMEAQADPQAAIMGKVIHAICEANGISSKGNTEVRATKVKEVGEMLLSTEGLAQAMSDYMTPLKFEEAFRHYVDTTKPELKAAAQRLGDVTHNYCAAIKKLFVDTSGWLWKQGDMEAVLEEVYGQVLCTESVHNLAALSGYLTFEDALEHLRNAVWNENKIPIEFWIKFYPALQRFFELLKRQNVSGEDVATFKNLLMQHADILRTLFFDKERTAQLDTMKEIFGEQWPSVKTDSLELYETFPTDTNHLDEQAFKAQGRTLIENFQQKIISTQIKELWKERTGTASPLVWRQQHSLPSEYALSLDDAKSMVDAVENPKKVSKEHLQKVLETLKSESVFVDGQKAGENFVKRAIPQRLQKIETQPQQLTEWLKNELGDNPDTWTADERFHDVVGRFIKHGYDAQVKKKVEEKVHALSDAEAKKMLLLLIEKHPDAGLSLLE